MKTKMFQSSCNLNVRKEEPAVCSDRTVTSHLSPKGRLQKFMLGKLVDFSIKWAGGVLLVH